jgi:nucleoside-diphosphate-sugar epimerase
MSKNLTEVLEQQELIQKLTERSPLIAKFIDALLMNEAKVYTKKGRLNKSGACRVLGWKTKQLEDIIEECRCVFPDLFEG